MGGRDVKEMRMEVYVQQFWFVDSDYLNVFFIINILGSSGRWWIIGMGLDCRGFIKRGSDFF